MHALPYAAWVALVAVLSSGADPAPVDVPACVPPACVEIAHGFLMSKPVIAIGDGDVVQWRADSGRHLFTEGAGSSGCLSFALEPGKPSHRVAFTVDSGTLYALHKVGGNATRSIPCTSALELPGSAFMLRYACQIHAREGGVGVLLVSDDA